MNVLPYEDRDFVSRFKPVTCSQCYKIIIRSCSAIPAQWTCG